MAAVMLTCTEEQRAGTGEAALYSLQFLRSCVKRGRHGHQIVERPEIADVILFVEGHYDGGVWGRYLEGLRATELYRKYRARCVAFCGMDFPVPLVPGIYPSIARAWHWRSLTRGGSYILPPNPHLRHVPLAAVSGGARWLGSFIGCTGEVPVRLRLTTLKDERLLIQDNTREFVRAIQEKRMSDVDALKRQFCQTTQESKFVICPRGVGTSSIRLFEAMEMGRAPVILSDEWVAPDGPDWPSFSVRVEEREIPRLGAILRQREADAEALGRQARAEWERVYSPEALFGTIVHDSMGLVSRAGLLRDLQLAVARLQLLRPLHLRQLWRSWKSSGS
ncbi:MAG TPA: exostosin family protein [Planctomycetota bacterium]|nr:exostosin family protein [Planctomycetota bacterium]